MEKWEIIYILIASIIVISLGVFLVVNTINIYQTNNYCEDSSIKDCYEYCLDKPPSFKSSCLIMVKNLKEERELLKSLGIEK